MTLNMRDKVELLLFLEKDEPALYFCHFCRKLHHWYRTWINALPPWAYPLCPQASQWTISRIYLSSSCVLPYDHARLIMNRHFYGSKHGPPLRTLEHYYSCLDSDGDRKVFHRTPRIIDDKLMLQSCIRISHPKGDSTSLRVSINTRGPRVYQHITLAKGRSFLTPMQLPELALGRSTPNLCLPCDLSFESCAFCLTDYSVNISWRGKKKGYVIKVWSFRQLGDCRSPSAWSWHSMSTMGGMLLNETRTRHYQDLVA
jgi:hypothetical protein